MRVRGNKKGRKFDSDGHLVRAIEPTRAWIAWRMADLQRTPQADFFTQANNSDGITFNNVDALVEIFDLEIELAKLDEQDGFPGAEQAKRQEHKRLFLEWLPALQDNPGFARNFYAEHIIKFRNLFFQPNDRALDPFKPFLKEMAECVAERQWLDHMTARWQDFLLLNPFQRLFKMTPRARR